jgi:hypothetical protein
MQSDTRRETPPPENHLKSGEHPLEAYRDPGNTSSGKHCTPSRKHLIRDPGNTTTGVREIPICGKQDIRKSQPGFGVWSSGFCTNRAPIPSSWVIMNTGCSIGVANYPWVSNRRRYTPGGAQLRNCAFLGPPVHTPHKPPLPLPTESYKVECAQTGAIQCLGASPQANHVRVQNCKDPRTGGCRSGYISYGAVHATEAER